MDEENDLVDAAFKPRIPSSALAHPIMQVGTNAQTTRQAWLEKSPQFGGFTGWTGPSQAQSYSLNILRCEPGTAPVSSWQCRKSAKAGPWLLPPTPHAVGGMNLRRCGANRSTLA